MNTAAFAMNADLTPALYRSEAFAEDLVGFVSPMPAETQAMRRLARWVNWLPLGVALIGVAFAVVPPLA